MRIWIRGLSPNDLSAVRGVGSYISSSVEAIKKYGIDYGIELDEKNPEIVIHPGFFPYTPFAPILGVKNMLVIHDLITLKHKKHFPAGLRGTFMWWRQQKNLTRFDGFITDTQVVKREINAMLGLVEKNIHVVYPVAKSIYYEQSKKVTSALIDSLPPRFFLYVGDVTWNKNLATLARAVMEANVTLVMVGRALTDMKDINHPWKRQFKEFHEMTRSDKRFILAGFLKEEELIELYRRAHSTILTSYDEGFGYPWLESALLKTPTILSDIPVLREVSKNSSLYVDPHSDYDIARAILTRMSENKEKIAKLEYEAAKDYSHKSFVTQLVDALTPYAGK